jgi:alpha-tubulin suppressor-like RCC1 family protein
MAVKSDGSVWAWGNGAAEPARIPGLDNVVAVRGSELSFVSKLALKADGTVWRWSDDDPVPVQVPDPADPTGYLTGVTAIASGARTHYALKSDGTVWAWGMNYFYRDESGLLGDGTTTDSASPVQCLNLSNIKAIAADRSHALALGADGRVWAWGGNRFGQLGDGTNTVRLAPIPVFPPDGTFSPGAVAIAASAYSSYVVRADGTVWSCGGNSNGQLGDGTTDSRNTWVRVGDLSGVASIASGENAWIAIVVKSDGSAWGWGLNDHGHLGCGTNGDVLLPCRVLSPGFGATGFLGGVVAAATDVDQSCFLTTEEPVRVSSIAMNARTARGKTIATAIVTVLDNFDSPVTDAVVRGHWSTKAGSLATGTTGPDGTATLSSPLLRGSKKSVTFVLDSVTKSGTFLDASRSQLTNSISLRR